ncbi:hypothetical protein BBO99_00008390 [Phytophthora kernoviae]|uniref:Transcriptional repressor Tup1 N-terminal domain-containing protein n=2 Tax=Phytophthora kernoviae TaxID=325452 RepID=A0A3R7G230_9STRA|nr:hypothetical protein G195_009697 [Phytophthora kernoviae 00238/432]KAG2517357.1 hypothetical protein JM18_007796 [Phytophthora kernoviae]KAG2522927.1 hypothetical protein JM16_004243 [Phytophthora kernoviae]RLN15379.1 hypothetical protein BBI17_009732 [Phytophthora kernoviae]RLN75361.1 hypothetical protein BBO99_00008390 [Phytophthora kernoviae]
MYTSSAPGPARGRGGNPNAGPPPQQQQPQQLRGPSTGNPGAPPQLATAATSRVGEMLDQVKVEYEAAIQQLNMAKMEQLEMERKIQSQVVEMDQIQQSLKALEANHRRIRQQYEEDMLRMRRQLESGQGPQQQVPPQQQQQPVAAKLPAKRSRAPPTSGAMQEDASLMSNLVAAATSSGRAATTTQPRGSGNSPVRVVPVQPASRSLQQLGQQPVPQLPPPPQGGSSNPPPQLSPLDTSNTNTTPSTRRMPSINSEVNGKDRAASSPPALKKSKLNGSEPSIPSLNANGKQQLPSVSSAGTAPTSSGMLPQVSKMQREQGSTSTNSSPSAASASQSQTASSSSTKNPSSPDAESSRATTTPTTTLSAASGNNATTKSSNSKASRLNWSCVYSSKTSMAYQESERPAAEMHQSMDHQSVVCCVRFSSDGTMMASGCHKTAQVFDVKTGDRKYLVARPQSANGQTPTSQANAAANEADDAYVRAVCFSPDCTKLVAGMPQNTIRVWDIAANEEGLSMTGHESEIYSLDYVNDLIVSGSGDRKVRVWDARNGQCKKIFGNESGGPSDGVTSVALSPDGRLLAAASLDKVVRIWDTETSQLLDRLEGHSDSVYSIAFSPDGKNVISGSLDRNIMLWDVCAQGRTTTRPRMLFQGHKDFVLSVAYTPDGRWLMSGSKDRSVVFWDPRSSRSVLTLTGYRNSVISVASSPASPYFATGSGDCFAVVWKYQCQTF